MLDFRREYEAVPRNHQGTPVSPSWNTGQNNLTVSKDDALNWHQYTCHLTIDEWVASGQNNVSKKIRKFHFSFKKRAGQPILGAQPGCRWEWRNGRFDFIQWFGVPSLNLQPPDRPLVATHVKAFIKRHSKLLFADSLSDPTMWATFDMQLQSPTVP